MTDPSRVCAQEVVPRTSGPRVDLYRTWKPNTGTPGMRCKLTIGDQITLRDLVDYLAEHHPHVDPWQTVVNCPEIYWYEPPTAQDLAEREASTGWLGCPGVHFEGLCLDCDAARLVRLKLAEVEDRYHTGRVSQAQFEAYMHVWATVSPARSRAEWRAEPTDPAVKDFVERLRGMRDRVAAVLEEARHAQP